MLLVKTLLSVGIWLTKLIRIKLSTVALHIRIKVIWPKAKVVITWVAIAIKVKYLTDSLFLFLQSSVFLSWAFTTDPMYHGVHFPVKLCSIVKVVSAKFVYNMPSCAMFLPYTVDILSNLRGCLGGNWDSSGILFKAKLYTGVSN